MATWRKNVKGDAKIHTVVGHKSPDPELIVQLFLWLFFPSTRVLLNAEDRLKTKWISAGPLNPKDWPRGVSLNIWTLIGLGYFTNDCGGGPADQHVLKGNKTSSLQLFCQLIAGAAKEVLASRDAGQRVEPKLVAAAEEMLEVLDVFKDVLVVINEGDLKGTDTATRKAEDSQEEYVVRGADESLDDSDAIVDIAPAHASSFAMMAAAAIDGGPAETVISQASTPHTRWNLRTFILGLNAMYGKDPDTVLEYALTAVTTLWLAALDRHQLLKDYEAYVAECQSKRVAPDAEAKPEEENVRDWFRMSAVIDRLDQAIVARRPELAKDRTAVDEAINDFMMIVGAAMQRWEAEWLSADDALYDSRTWRGKVTLQPQVEPEAIPGKRAKVKPARDVWVVMGETPSQRFGQRCRFGNRERAVYEYCPEAGRKVRKVLGPRPQQDKPELDKASVVIQWYSQGKFVVSTAENIRLDRVALVYRYVDLLLAGVELDEASVADLSQPGNFSYRNRDGEYIHAMYFTNYLTNVGNAFRAKPDHQPCRLTPTMARELLVQTLQTSFEIDALEIAKSYMSRAWSMYRQEMQRRGTPLAPVGGRRGHGGKGRRGRGADLSN